MSATPAPLTEAADDRLDTLFRRLAARHAIVGLDTSAAAGWTAPAGPQLLLLLEEPRRSPESWDMAVLLPEIVSAVAGAFPGLGATVADPAASRTLSARYATSRLPALIAFRDGDYLGALEGLRDWAALVPAAAALLAGPARRVPGVGIAVRAEGAGPSCH